MQVQGSLHLMAGGQIVNLRVENLALDPVTPYAGQVWFNTAEGVVKYYDGTNVIVLATGGNLDEFIAKLASLELDLGASLVGIHDLGGLISATTVEGAFQEIFTALNSEVSNRTSADSTDRADLASFADAAKGASLVGVYDAAGLLDSTDVEAALNELIVKHNAEVSARTSADTAIRTDVASNDTAKGASLVGIEDASSLITATTVEGALQEIFTALNSEVSNRVAAINALIADLASVESGKGASLVGIEDAAAKFTATTVEGVLVEMDTAYKAADTQQNNDLASVSAGKGAALVGIQDADAYFTALTVEGALKEVYEKVVANDSGAGERLDIAEAEIDDLEAALGSATGAAGMVYATTNYVVSGTTAVAAISALDAQLKATEELVGSSDLQTAYENSAANAPDGHARIKLETGRDLRFVDDTDDSTYFMVDAETGNVVITGSLIVTGTTTSVDSSITEFTSQAIKTGTAGIVGLDIRPGAAFTAVPSEVIGTGNGSQVTFSGTLTQTDVQSVIITDSIETFTDDKNGFLVGSAGGTGTIDYATGAYSVTFNAAPANTQSVNTSYSYADGFITPTADLFSTRSNAEALTADVRIDSAGVLILETAALQAKAGVAVTGNITVTGTVDGVDVAGLKSDYDTHVNGAASKHDATEIDYEKVDANYITPGASVEVALTEVDAKIKTIDDIVGSGEGETLTSRIADAEAAIGSTEGVEGLDYASTNYVTLDSPLLVSVAALDAALKTTADDLATEVIARTNADTADRNDLASTDSAKGASLVGIEDAGSKIVATTVEGALQEAFTKLAEEATARTNADTAIYTAFAAETGAALVGIEDVAAKFAATTVEGVLAEIDTAYKAADAAILSSLAATTASNGASLVGVQDALSNFTATTVEGVLAELQANLNQAVADNGDAITAVYENFAATTAAKGASLVGIEDVDGYLTATTVEGAIKEISERITNSTFIYSSESASTSHLVNHMFGQQFCTLVVIDATNNMVIPQSVVFNSANQATVTFNSAIDCTVVCNK